jgi:hypothetical protein
METNRGVNGTSFRGDFGEKKTIKYLFSPFLKTCLKNRFMGIWRGTARSHHREYKEHREREEDRQGYVSTHALRDLQKV